MIVLLDAVAVQRARNASAPSRLLAEQLGVSVTAVRALAAVCLACGASPATWRRCGRDCGVPVCACGNHRGSDPDLDALEVARLGQRGRFRQRRRIKRSRQPRRR